MLQSVYTCVVKKTITFVFSVVSLPLWLLEISEVTISKVATSWLKQYHILPILGNFLAISGNFPENFYRNIFPEKKHHYDNVTETAINGK